MTSYYLLSPCRTTAAYTATLKRRHRLDLGAARRVLEAAGHAVTDIKVMLIVDTTPEATLYESGKVLVKTNDPAEARRVVDAIYGLVGVTPTAPAAPTA